MPYIKSGEVEGDEECDKEAKGDGSRDDLKIRGEGNIWPPPLENNFQPIFTKGPDELVKVTDYILKNENVAKSLLNGIALDEDLKLYKNLPMTKMIALQD